MPGHAQDLESCLQVQLRALRNHDELPWLRRAELSLDHTKWMLTSRMNVNLNHLNQIIQIPFRSITMIP